jgi:peptidyl-tRNA hydrolase
MSSGKIAAQIAHASFEVSLNEENFHSPVIVLDATQKQMLEHSSEAIAIVRDAGKTEVPEGSLTVMVFALNDDDDRFNHMSLL